MEVRVVALTAFSREILVVPQGGSSYRSLHEVPWQEGVSADSILENLGYSRTSPWEETHYGYVATATSH